MWIALWALVGCWGDSAYIIHGKVIEVRGDEVVLDHEAVPGLMGAMTMPFTAAPGALPDGLKPGDTVVARYQQDGRGGRLERVRVTGFEAPSQAMAGPVPLKAGEVLPAVALVGDDGASLALGAGQGQPVILTFLYTRCPIPEACPATVSKLQALQARRDADGPLLVAVTLDPEFDTPSVLKDFGVKSSADPTAWRFGHLADADALNALAMRAGLPVLDEGETILHGIRWLVLDSDGRLVRRYDDHAFDLDEALSVR